MFSLQSNEHKKEHLLLIIGCGRSGTYYISQLLTKAGLKMSDENYRDREEINGISSWWLTVDPTNPPSPPTNNFFYLPPGANIVFKHTFHQVRHPLDVISSWYYNNINYENIWGYICRHIPEIKQDEPLLVKCAKYWYYWNIKAEKRAEWTYRVEDIDTLLDEIENRLELKTPLDKKALSSVSRKTNVYKPIVQKIKWSDLKKTLCKEDFNKLQALADKYGYSIQDLEPTNKAPLHEGKRLEP